MAIKIGITGGIGSGKSIVSRLLETMGIPVYISDIESKRITNTDPAIRQSLCDLLGNEVYKNGQLNKPLLASYIFGSSEHIQKVNAIIHPQVKDDFRNWSASFKSADIIGIESAILLEAGFKEEVDIVVLVYAPLETRIQRAMKRDQASQSSIEDRIRSQKDDEEKCKFADFIIINDGEKPLIPQVLELISSVSKNNYYLCPAKK